MDLKEKRKNELDIQKNQRKEDVISSALEVFKKQGIESTKMTDIAEKAEVGVASVYRYFKTKPDLAVEVACRFWQQEITELNKYYNDQAFLNKNGITKVKEILQVFIKLYKEHTEFIRFIDEFDRYVVKEKISKEKLKDYEENIIDLKSICMEAIDIGKKDGTIREDLCNDQFYFSINHALMSLCQKLILSGDVLESDEYINGEEQIKIIIDMAIRFISN
ncbi:TetR/AcrR family transcriptional regulator [Clostridium sp. C2-6-12]|uniref:TetR/AcrR family transcriptional regulator n=1 Tax=Clostridium sp. C2-6-12 TaxID=2698832 RepID=UPI0013704E81|nr:TetR/AcrR family transcriptional regulator [Clostridium sp. C2-6-12]